MSSKNYRVSPKCLYQHILESTRGGIQHTPSILNFILSNVEGMIDKINMGAPLGGSDHYLISFDFGRCITRNTNKKSHYLYDKGNFTEMKKMFDKNCIDNVKNHPGVEDRYTDVDKGTRK